MSRAPGGSFSAMATIFSPAMPRSQRIVSVAVATVPLRIVRSSLSMTSAARSPGADLVSPAALGAIYRLVGAGQELLQRERLARAGSGADADGQRHGWCAVADADRVRLHLGANALGGDD